MEAGPGTFGGGLSPPLSPYEGPSPSPPPPKVPKLPLKPPSEAKQSKPKKDPLSPKLHQFLRIITLVGTTGGEPSPKIL